MPNPFDDGFVPEELPEGEDEDFEPDVATVAFLDQQQAEFGNMEEEFEATYGFAHNCHCGEDYAAGRVGEITQCYHNMMQEALATCARLNAELGEMTSIAQALYSELRGRIEAEGGEGELREVAPDSDEGSVQGPASALDESGSDAAADDAAGEGFGSTPIEPGNTNDEGTPGDRKLV